jgi:tripartite ATP-independent transporter DctP family solute receptor
MRLNRIIIGIAIAASAAGAWAQTNLKLGLTTATGSAFHAGALAMADEFAKLTQGRYKITVFPSGALGGEKEMLESIKDGSLDLEITSSGPVGNFVPDILVTDIPFLFRDYPHARKTLDGPIGQELLAKFPEKGIIALAWGENGFRHLTNSKRAVNTPEDLKGLKVRTMENQVHMTAFRTLGATPAPMAFTELFTALQTGAVDGQENPIQIISSSKFGQVQKNLSLTGHVYSPGLVLASPAAFNALSAADKKSLQDAAKVGVVAMRKRVIDMETTGVADLKAQGVNVVTDIDKSKFQAALAPAYAEYAKKFGAENIQRIRDVK